MNTHAFVAKPEETASDHKHPVIELINVVKHFGPAVGLDGLSLKIYSGKIVGIIGRSGAGKSTLIRCLNGLEKPETGEIFVENTPITGLEERDLQPLRRRIGVIFQHFNLLSSKNVADNIALPLKIAGVAKAERMRRAAELLDLVGLSEKAKSYPSELSGGQKQRVGIARALAARPALLLSDEATSALDPETTRSILELLKDINRKLGVTIVLITHEMDVIRTIADTVVVLDKGRILEEGLVSDVFSSPKSETAKSLLASVRPSLDPDIRRELVPYNEGVHAERVIIQVDLSGQAASSTLFVDLGSHFGHAFQVLQGGIEIIQGETIARFFIEISPQPPQHLNSIIKFLKAHSVQVEILGHDPRPL